MSLVVLLLGEISILKRLFCSVLCVTHYALIVPGHFAGNQVQHALWLDQLDFLFSDCNLLNFGIHVGSNL